MYNSHRLSGNVQSGVSLYKIISSEKERNCITILYTIYSGSFHSKSLGRRANVTLFLITSETVFQTM